MEQSNFEALSEAFGEAMEAEDLRSARIPAVTVTIEYPLQPEHLAAYAEAHGSLPAVKSDEKDLAVVRARHHSVARFLAAGISEGIVAELTNFTAPYISTLKNSPSMQELIAHYRAPGDQAALHIAEQLRTVGTAALASLADDLENGKLDANVKLQLAKLGLDRSGHGPSSTQHNITEHRIVGVEEVARLASQARRRNQERIIDVQAIRKALPGPDEAL